MKSYLIRCENLEQAVRDWDWKISDHTEEVRDALEQAVLPYASYISPESVRPGDIVSVSLHSDMARFNRALKLNVGSGMFDRNLEEALSGHKAGDEFSCRIPQGEVVCRIVEISRLVLPEVSDEIALEQGIAGVSTAEELKKYYYKEACGEELRPQIGEFLKCFCDKCEFFISEEDICLMDEEELQRCREISIGMGKVFDEMRGNEMLGAVGCHDIDEFRDMIRALHIGNLKKALIASTRTREAFSLESEQVYIQIHKLEEEILRQVTGENFF